MAVDKPADAERLIIALDVDYWMEAENLVRELSPVVGIFKVGLQLFANVGPDILVAMRRWGGRSFADLKLHDIPNTVAAAARVLTRSRAAMFTVHTAGGRSMMAAAVAAAREEAEEMEDQLPLVVGVTVLTSMDGEELQETGVRGNLQQVVVDRARLAQDTGLNGVVASVQEAAAIRAACGREFIIVTPGIRPVGAGGDDQRRRATPAAAVASGADYLVVGRPIIGEADHLAAARRILAEMEPR